LTGKFLLITTGMELLDGRRLTAFEIAAYRLERQEWPIYSSTRHKSDFAPGDKVLVYLGGSKGPRQVIIASAVIASTVIHNGNRPVFEGQGKFDNDASWSTLCLTDVQHFVTHVEVSELISELEMAPKNTNKWGVAVFGGARRVSTSDYHLITSRGFSSGVRAVREVQNAQLR
jgi:hypothetical protein